MKMMLSITVLAALLTIQSPECARAESREALQAKTEAALASLRSPKPLHWGALQNAQKKELWEILQPHLLMFGGELLQAQTLREQVSILGSVTTIEWTDNDDATRNKGLRKIKDRVVQVLDGKRVLTEGSDTCLVLDSTEKLVEGSALSTWAKEDGSYSFVSVSGASRKIQQMAAVAVLPPTFAQFLEALKKGERFKVFSPLEIVCPECEGKRLAKQERDVHKAAAFCPACRGNGKTTIRGVAELVW